MVSYLFLTSLVSLLSRILGIGSTRINPDQPPACSVPCRNCAARTMTMYWRDFSGGSDYAGRVCAPTVLRLCSVGNGWVAVGIWRMIGPL